MDAVAAANGTRLRGRNGRGLATGVAAPATRIHMVLFPGEAEAQEHQEHG